MRAVLFFFPLYFYSSYFQLNSKSEIPQSIIIKGFINATKTWNEKRRGVKRIKRLEEVRLSVR